MNQGGKLVVVVSVVSLVGRDESPELTEHDYTHIHDATL